MKTGEKAEKFDWQTIQDEIAEEKSAAIVLLDETASEIAVSNNNSICKFLYSSKDFASHCAEFCGKAFETAYEAGEAIHVKCHADLNFLTVPVQTKNKKLAAIVGRNFLKTEDYRRATERAGEGDWQQFPFEQLFSNVLFSRSAKDLEKAARSLEKLSDEEKNALADFVAPKQEIEEPETKTAVAETEEKFREEIRSESVSSDVAEKNALELEEFSAWREVFDSLLDSNYRQAWISAMNFLSERYAVSNTAWLEPRENYWEKVFAEGNLKERKMRIEIPGGDERLFETLRSKTALELRERASSDGTEKLQTLRMFPYAVGGEMRGALIVADEIEDENIKKHIAGFLQNIAPKLEILRLRHELEQREKLSGAIKKFNEKLKDIDAEDFWNSVVRVSAELMQAERGSLLVFDETEQKFYFKAATGNRADFIEAETETLGEKISLDVLNSGKPVAVENIEERKFPNASTERNYKTKSFISYPIKIGERRIGIFNAADKIDGSFYNESDLDLLDALAPQIAVTLDRTTLKKKAGEFEQLSITDALTGLLNRRYLEERLSEEINRFRRNGDSVSFMMIDVDEFKSYNDKFSHPEGDKALQIVGRLMKETLRSEDVAARYGGEEFSILLPQTTLPEACIIAERIRQKVEHEKFPNRKVTISIGVASVSSQVSTPHDLISAADKALYKAKQAGRNTIKIHENPSSGSSM